MSNASFFRDKSVLITGASSGIGEELAVQLAALGAGVTITARRRDVLDALAQKIATLGHGKVAVAECDVSRDGELERAVEVAIRAFGRIDVVVANAGFGVTGALKRLTIEDYRRQFETNVFGVLRTIYAALPQLEKSRGNLVIVGSVAGWVASPGGSPYSMSKFALRALSEAITPELRRVGVKVTLISPGLIVSNFRRIDNQGNFHEDAPDHAPQWLQMSTKECVRQMLSAIAHGKREKIITGHGKAMVLIGRVSPWAIGVLARRFAPKSRQ
jgi:short-subunit dehydrogenase